MPNTAIHPELLREYPDGLQFYDFAGCDSDDIGRWYMESWNDAMNAEDDEKAQENFWFARACGYELRQRSRPIVCQ